MNERSLRRARPWAPLSALVLLAAPLAAAVADDAPGELVWDARAARHLLNRAGFGARPDEVRAAVETGPEAFVRSLIEGPEGEAGRDPFFAERLSPRERLREERRRMGRRGDGAEPGMDPGMMAEGDSEEARRRREQEIREMRDADRVQLQSFTADWVERILAGDDPLRERMTLFWHGHFTSSMRDVKSSFELIRQNELLRANALGRFSDLLNGIARDPAMLEYLDNDSNRRGSPNENFARELMELFALGEGHYTEQDVKEAARAFTGWTDRDGAFTYVWRWHDAGEKTVLGVTGPLGGDDVIEVLLEQEACGRHVARKLVTYFEGVEPDAERVEEYAALFRESDGSIAALLEALFLDPRFYREEVVGTRIASPIDYLVGHVRRLGLHPPGRMLAHAATLAGQELFEPPSVKGWEGGEAWITTSSMIARSNLMGGLLGLVDPREAFARRRSPGDLAPRGVRDEGEDDPTGMDGGDAGMEEEGRVRGPSVGPLRLLARMGGPFLNLLHRVESSGAVTDAEIVDLLLAELLAVDPSEELRAEALAFLAEERASLAVADGSFLDAGRRAERSLRRLAHLILSLPDAHLH